MASACGAMPYSATTRSYATFEGLETKTEFDASVNKLLDDLEKLGENDESIKQKIKEIRSIDDSGYDKKVLKASLKGLTDVESSDMYKQIKKFIQEKLSDQEEMKVKEEEVNVKEGFENRSQSIDIFGTAVGNQNCVKTASGLSNSMGALCLSDEQLYMLQSRGGNSTGRDSQIGA
jgi:hypothetical protein